MIKFENPHFVGANEEAIKANVGAIDAWLVTQKRKQWISLADFRTRFGEYEAVPDAELVQILVALFKVKIDEGR